MRHSTGEILCASSFNIFGFSSSGPAAFDGSRLGSNTGTCGQDPMSCQKSSMDRNYCLIVFIVYMSYSDT